MKSCPTLETPRLILRPHSKEDLGPSLALWTNPAVYQPILKRPSTEAETWSRLLKYAGLWSLLGFGYFALIEKASNTMIGELGFADFYRDLTPSIVGLPEMGWVLHPDFHGQGLMTEAIQALRVWGKENLPFDKVVCIIDPTNEPSIRLATRCGFVKAGDAVYEGQPTLLLECKI